MDSENLVETGELSDAALAAQHFKMLSDIAEELNGAVVFPISFDLTLSIRGALKQKSASDELLGKIRLDPLICARLLREANARVKAKAKRKKFVPISSISEALATLDTETINKIASGLAANQLLRSRNLAELAEWTGQLWERTLGMAASAYVVAKRLTALDQNEVMFSALCGDLGLYYMLYRATQYPELLAQPPTLKQLVVAWHGGITESLLRTLGLPMSIIDPICHEPTAAIPPTPATLSDVLRISRMLTGYVFRGESGLFKAQTQMPELSAECLALEGEIRSRRNEMRRIYS